MPSDLQHFDLGCKALVTPADDGTLYLSGVAANWEQDRENESFDVGAFKRGLDTWLTRDGAPLVFHHDRSAILGRVLTAEVKADGLHVTARVDPQPLSSPLRYVYEAISRKSLVGLSLGGYFARAMVNGVKKIVNVEPIELSVTPAPVGRGTTFSLIPAPLAEAKALLEEEALTLARHELDLISLRITTYEARRQATRALLGQLVR